MSPKKHVPKCKPESKTVGGLVLPKKLFPDEKCLSGLSYTPDPGDIFIVTYPKSGTTWTQYIVWEILNFGAPPPPDVNTMMKTYVPYLETTGRESIVELSLPRAIKTHLPYHLQPYHPFAKYIYVARNPRDTCVSYYHHVKEMPSVFGFSDGTLDDFFESFLLGEVAYGDWLNHVLSWYVHKDDLNVLFLTYEMMKRDPEKSILTIAKFIGKDYVDRLTSDSSLLKRIVEITSFQNMKTMDFYIPKEGVSFLEASQVTSNEEKFYKVDFFWRGKIGNWKEFLSKEQVERLNETFFSRPRGKEIAALWDE